jgi:hypothetical protein
MPGVQAHLVRAEENEALACGLIFVQSRCTDWVTVALFYAALHRIEALLHRLGVPEEESRGHRKRRVVLETLPALAAEQELRDDYFGLADDSMDARYECRRLSQAEVRTLRDVQLARIKARVARLMR